MTPSSVTRQRLFSGGRKSLSVCVSVYGDVSPAPVSQLPPHDTKNVASAHKAAFQRLKKEGLCRADGSHCHQAT